MSKNEELWELQVMCPSYNRPAALSAQPLPGVVPFPLLPSLPLPTPSLNKTSGLGVLVHLGSAFSFPQKQLI